MRYSLIYVADKERGRERQRTKFCIEDTSHRHPRLVGMSFLPSAAQAEESVRLDYQHPSDSLSQLQAMV